MSESAAATIPAVPVEPSKRRRIIKIVSWILALVVLLVILHLAGVDVWGWLTELWDTVTEISLVLRRPRLLLPGAADDADRPRLVRDPALRVPGRRDVHGRARVVRNRRRAQQLPPGEHRHVRDAAHVPRDRPGCDVPRDPRGLRRPEDLLPRHRHAHLHLPLQPGRGLVRLPVRERARRAPEPSGDDARDHRRRDLPHRDPATDLLAEGEGDVAEGEGGRRDPRRPSRVREVGPAPPDGRLRGEGHGDHRLPRRVLDPGDVRLRHERARLEPAREPALLHPGRRRRQPGVQHVRPRQLHGRRRPPRRTRSGSSSSRLRSTSSSRSSSSARSSGGAAAPSSSRTRTATRRSRQSR